MPLSTTPLDPDLSFGARVSGVERGDLQDPSVRDELNRIFEDRGMIVFEDVEPSTEMQLALSDVFGPLKDHPVKTVARVNQDEAPGVIEMKRDPDISYIVEVDGTPLMGWLPWHFDHCYNDELNRAGVLRATTIPAEGGLTGFADGIDLYRDLSPYLRQQIEGLNVIYTLDLLYEHMRFGRPESLRVLRPQPRDILDVAKTLPRALHPAVWTRASGEKVLHVSGWHSVGLEHREDVEGDGLLEAVCQEIIRVVRPYFHAWKETDMVIWDNWRMLHSSTGFDPACSRNMHRTTIRGDYGLGYFEEAAAGSADSAA